MAENPSEVRKSIEGELASLQDVISSMLESGLFTPAQIVENGFDPMEVGICVSILEFEKSSLVIHKPAAIPAVHHSVTVSSSPVVVRPGEHILSAAEVNSLVQQIRTAVEHGEHGLKTTLLENLTRVLELNTTLLCLELDELQLDDKDAECIAWLLSKNKTIQYVSLKRNKIRDAGMICIAEALQSNTTVDTLLVGENLIGNKSTPAISNLFKTNNTLRFVDLESNQIDEGVVTLGQGIRGNKGILSLNLCKNKIRDLHSLQQFSYALEASNHTLVYLRFDTNPFCMVGQQGEVAHLEFHKNIKVYLKRNSNELFRSIELLKQNLTAFADMSSRDLEKYGIDKYKEQLKLYKAELELGLRKIRFISQDSYFLNTKVSLDQLFKQCEKKVSGVAREDTVPEVVDEPITTHLAKASGKLNIRFNYLKFGNSIGEGSFGVVYEGSLNYARVAIKTLKPTEDLRLQQGFLREMEMLASAKFPHIVQLLGIAELPKGQGYAIVTEFMPKGSLSSLLYSPDEISWEIRYRIARGVMCALEFLHTKGISHRDLKDDNVMLTGEFDSKLIDLGFARYAKTSSLYPALQSEGIVGTPLYFSPETLERVRKQSSSGRKDDQFQENSSKVDIWCLGILLNQIVTRQRPYAKVSVKSMPNLIDYVFIRDQRDIIPASTPLFFSDNIKRCWKKVPEERPTAGQLLEAHDVGVTAEKKVACKT